MFIFKQSTLTHVQVTEYPTKVLDSRESLEKAQGNAFQQINYKWKLENLAQLKLVVNRIQQTLLAGEKKRKKIVTVETFNFDTLTSVLKLIYQYLILIGG